MPNLKRSEMHSNFSAQ